MATLLTLEQEAARLLGFYMQVTPSATGANTYTFVVDGTSAQVDDTDTDAIWQDCWLKVEADSAVTPLNVGEVRRVKTYTASTSTFTLATDRGFSNACTATMTIGVYRTVPPGTGWAMRSGWRYYVNKALRNLRYRRASVLTLVTDGDMETSGVTSWTASNATHTKVTAAANVAWGSQASRVQNSSANGYIASGSLPATTGDLWALRADFRCASGTANLVAWDDTNGAEIESESSTSRDWRSMDLTFNVPSDCYSVSFRLKGSESDADVYWDNLMARPAAARRLPLPSWVDSEQCVEGLFEDYGWSTQNEDVLLSSSRRRALPHYAVLPDPTGATAWWVEFRFLPVDRALLLVRGLSAYAELSSDSGTTSCPQDLAVTAAALEAARDLNDEKLLARIAPRWRAYRDRLPRRSTLLPGVY